MRLFHFIKGISFLMCMSFVSTTTLAQKNTTPIGYIEYRSFQYGNSSSIEKYDFYFNKESCITITALSANPYDEPSFKGSNVEHNSKDSIEQYSHRERMIDDSINSYRVYKDITENVYRALARDDYKQRYCVNDTVPVFEWDLTDDTCTILGFRCLRAKRTNTIGAVVSYWYTPEIPLPFGPGKRGGLPGLILKTEDNITTKILVATKIEIPHHGNEKIVSPKSQGKEASSKEFSLLLKKQNEDQMKVLQMYGGKVE